MIPPPIANMRASKRDLATAPAACEYANGETTQPELKPLLCENRQPIQASSGYNFSIMSKGASPLPSRRWPRRNDPTVMSYKDMKSPLVSYTWRHLSRADYFGTAVRWGL